MDQVTKLEVALAEQFNKLPFHLPTDVRAWIATNAWWIIIIGVVASVFSIWGSLQVLFFAQSTIDSAYEAARQYGITMPAYSNPMADVSLWIGIIVFVAVLVLQVKAINPLRSMSKRGWDLVFLSMLISLAGSFLTSVIIGSVLSGLFGLILGIAIGGFFLFEIRSNFAAVKAKHTKA